MLTWEILELPRPLAKELEDEDEDEENEDEDDWPLDDPVEGASDSGSGIDGTLMFREGKSMDWALARRAMSGIRRKWWDCMAVVIID